MSKPLSLYGSINYTDLKEALRNPKISAKKVQTKDGEKIMVDVIIWVKEEADEYNQNASMQVSFKKELRDDKEKRPYVGNFRFMTPTVQEATPEDLAAAVEDDDDLGF